MRAVNRIRVVLAGAAVLALVVAAIVLAPRWLPGLRPEPPPARTAPSLAAVRDWAGGRALTDDSLRGRPYALLAWTDADPRSLAALNVADVWHRAFSPHGVRVLALHTPDFAFAADTSVPGRLVRRLGLTLPVALDPSLAETAVLGGATDGPHLIVVSAAGEVLVDTVGVAGLAAGELALREALARERPGAALPPSPRLPDDLAVRTVYLGASRSPAGPLAKVAPGRVQTFTAEFRHQQEGRPWVAFPVGSWRPLADGLESHRGGAADFVAIRYSAARAGVVVSPPGHGEARLWVLRDEKWPDAAARDADVSGDAGGAWVNVTEPRLYWVDRGAGERVLKLSPDRAGLVIHAFVFEGVPPGAAKE